MNLLHLQKKEVKFSTYNEKFKQYEFFDKQKNILTIDELDKIKKLNSQLTLAQGTYQKYFTRYEKMTNIERIRKQIFHLTEKISNYEGTIDSLKKIIHQKRSDLHISSSIFSLNRDAYKEKVQSLDKNK